MTIFLYIWPGIRFGAMWDIHFLIISTIISEGQLYLKLDKGDVALRQAVLLRDPRRTPSLRYVLICFVSAVYTEVTHMDWT